jgi:hypothetical protein
VLRAVSTMFLLGVVLLVMWRSFVARTRRRSGLWLMSGPAEGPAW